jgi:hypothetical protein
MNYRSQIQKLLKSMMDEVLEREEIFLSKSEKWQDGPIGDKYSEKTEGLREVGTLIEESLTYLPK